MLSQSQIQTLLFGKPIPESIGILVTINRDYLSDIKITGQRHTIKAICNQLSKDRETKTSIYIQSENVDSLLTISNQLKVEMEQQGFEIKYKVDDWR